MLKLWRAVCLFSFGGMIEACIATDHGVRSVEEQIPIWGTVFGVSVCGWAGTAIGDGLRKIAIRLLHAVMGRPQPLPETDPKALAAEIAALNAQIASLRDTATSFDVSFDETLQRLDERLRRMEQQSAYIQPQTQTLRPGL